MHSIDSQLNLDEQSARSNNDIISYFVRRECRCEKNFPRTSPNGGGGTQVEDGEKLG